MDPDQLYVEGTLEAEVDLSAVVADLVHRDIKGELWREYDFGDRVYRIDDPVQLMFRQGGSTHRILDGSGVVHCLPAPGHCGCVLRWLNRPGLPRCRF